MEVDIMRRHKSTNQINDERTKHYVQEEINMLADFAQQNSIDSETAIAMLQAQRKKRSCYSGSADT